MIDLEKISFQHRIIIDKWVRNVIYESDRCLSTAWEFMFTKSQYHTEDIQSQGALLNRVSQLVERGIIKTTFKENLGILNVSNLAIAHAKLESGKTIGKLVLTGI